jgi:multimeric flavodoxin WrbA
MTHLAGADAIMFGAPIYMGSTHGLFKLFLESGFTPWLDHLRSPGRKQFCRPRYRSNFEWLLAWPYDAKHK